MYLFLNVLRNVLHGVSYCPCRAKTTRSSGEATFSMWYFSIASIAVEERMLYQRQSSPQWHFPGTSVRSAHTNVDCLLLHVLVLCHERLIST